jgi:hypothetical protein
MRGRANAHAKARGGLPQAGTGTHRAHQLRAPQVLAQQFLFIRSSHEKHPPYAPRRAVRRPFATRSLRALAATCRRTTHTKITTKTIHHDPVILTLNYNAYCSANAETQLFS